MADPRGTQHLIKSVVHASQIIGAFRRGAETLRLRDVIARTGITRMTCYRQLLTLEQCGFLEKVGENLYRSRFTLLPNRKYTVGYASLGQSAAFPRDVQSGLVQAAERANCELIVVDNRFNSKTALRNADRLVKEKVDLAIVFQTDESIAPSISTKFLDARIPLITIDIPHPGATYFGANNYRAGVMGGHHLGHWANQHWDGVVDEILILEITRAGSMPLARVQGMLAGIEEVIRGYRSIRVIKLDGDGMFGPSQDVVRGHLRSSDARRILVGAATDPSALGALRAFEEAGRLSTCAVVGQNADPEGRNELRASGTRLIGSVAYFPERYGEPVIRLARNILEGNPTPPALFTKHQLVTQENVNRIYPNDNLVHADQAW